MQPELAEQIARQEVFFAPLIATPAGVTFETEELGGVPVEWTTPATGATAPDLVILYFHGGGYSNGLARWARRATARLALNLGCRVAAPDYRLAPRFPFPAAHDDALAVYRELIGPRGYAPERVAVAGDSAGGALTVSLMADARDQGLPLPACGLLNSLWADVALNTPSLDDPVRNGFDIRRSMVEGLSATLLATGGVDPYDPRHSPVYRDLRGLPPLLIQAAGRDICHDDSIRLAASARAAGVTVQITEYADVEHIWILNGTHRIRYPEGRVAWVDVGEEPPEAVTAIEEMSDFVRRHARAAGPRRTMNARAAIENFWRMQDGGDYTRLPDLFAEDATLVDPFFGTFQGKDAIRGFMAKMVEEMGGRKTHFRVVEIAGDGEVAWAQWVAVTPRGEIEGCGLYKVRDGKLTYYRDYMNGPAAQPA